MPTLDTLPPELLYEIHILSSSPHLPYTNQQTYHILGLFPPSSHVAQYLLYLYPYPQTSARELLVRCLRHPICTLEVVKNIERYWKARTESGGGAKGKIKSPGKLELLELPKQLFRDLGRKSVDAYAQEVARATGQHMSDSRGGRGSSAPKSGSNLAVPPPPMSKSIRKRKRAATPPAIDGPQSLEPFLPTLLPFLDYLFTHYSPSPSSHKGFPLCASITAHSTSLPLTRFLLDKGADPGCNDGYAVRLAIGKGDLRLVKMLVEREEDGQGSKKRRLGDRCKVDSQMLRLAVKYQARDITDYLLEKGVVPDMKTLLALNSQED